MNKTTQRQMVSLMLATFFNILFSGCSLTGYFVGSAIDGKGSQTEVILPTGLDSLAPGAEVRILKKDQTHIEGMYVSRDSIEMDVARGVSEPGESEMTEDSESFEKWQKEVADSLGLLVGTKVTVTVFQEKLRRRDRYVGTFAGFNPGVIMIESNSGERPLRLKLEFIEEVTDSAGRSLVTGEFLIRAEKHAGRQVTSTESLKEFVPCIVIGEGRKARVPIDEIDTMYFHQTGNAKWIGLFAGVLIDAVIAAVIAKEIRSLGGGWWGGGSGDWY